MIMETDTILLKDPYVVQEEDRISIAKSREDFKSGRFKDNEQVLKEVKEKYESILG